MTNRRIYSEKLKLYYRERDGAVVPSAQEAGSWYMRSHAASLTAAKLNYMNYEGASDWRVLRK